MSFRTRTSRNGRVPSGDALAAFPPLPEHPRVSVVIPALNEELYIGPLLDSFEGQRYDGEIEVIVADGGSTDSTREIVERVARESRLAAVHIIENPERTTATGLNHGIRVATGEVIIIFGAHAAAAPNFIAANVAALRSSGAAVTGGPLQTLGEGLSGASIAAALSHPFGVGDARFRYASEAGEVDTVAFGAYRREVFELIGGFDPTRDKGEDDHLNYLVRANGGRIFLDPAIRSTYYARSSFTGIVRQYYGYGKAKGSALADDPAMLGPRHLVPTAAVLSGGGLSLLSFVSKRAKGTLFLATAAYSALAIVAGRRAAVRVAGAHPLVTAATFPLVHVSYGVGVIAGWARRRAERRSPSA